MERRALLAALTPLAAGCFSGVEADNAESDQQPKQQTPTDTPSETSTPTPSSDPDAAAEYIETAEDALREAVYIYNGDVTGDITDISAATDEFDARSVLLKLDEVQSAVGKARAVATPEQQETVEQMAGLTQFISQATDLQAWLIEGHDAASVTHEAIVDEADDATVDEDLDRLGRAYEQTTDPLDQIIEGTSAASTAATDIIGETDYEEKVTQFEAEQQVLDRLEEELSQLQSGRNQLQIAEIEADRGEFREAEDAAYRATRTLDEVVREFETLDDDHSSRANAFSDLIEDALETARDVASDAEARYDQYS